MEQEQAGRQTFSSGRFLRLVLLFWIIAVVTVVVAAAFAPYAARVTDVVLHWTSHRHWRTLHLETERPFFDLTTPITTVKSYYSTLYQADYERSKRLAHGLFRDQLRLRQAYGQDADSPAVVTYRSFVYVDQRSETEAVVVEKFHLFWRQGLRFRLQRQRDHWSIAALELLP